MPIAQYGRLYYNRHCQINMEDESHCYYDPRIVQGFNNSTGPSAISIRKHEPTSCTNYRSVVWYGEANTIVICDHPYHAAFTTLPWES